MNHVVWRFVTLELAHVDCVSSPASSVNFRTFLFWLHLAAGLVSGVSIGIMCFTGTVLAFEKELIAWSERDARRVDPPAGNAPRLPLEQLRERLRQARPDAAAASVVLQNDPGAAVAFTAGRSGGNYVNPYTGEVRQPASTAMSGFMRTMTDLHRYLGLSGAESRPIGKLINGVCNLAFCVLAVTGLYLWMPRTWSWRTVQPVIWFRQNSTGKARDFNWHNAIGFWTAPILIVLTLTAVPISFRWGGTLINTLTGTPAPAATANGGSPGRAGPGTPGIAVTPPAPDAKPMTADALVQTVTTAYPTWRTLTLRLDGGERQAAMFTVRTRDSWPRTANTTVAVDPYTGSILRRTGYADLPAAQQVRSWTRFLHTGEALGWMGQLVAGVASLGGALLVYTGFALSWRRFFGQRRADSALPVESRSATVAGK